MWLPGDVKQVLLALQHFSTFLSQAVSSCMTLVQSWGTAVVVVAAVVSWDSALLCGTDALSTAKYTERGRVNGDGRWLCAVVSMQLVSWQSILMDDVVQVPADVTARLPSDWSMTCTGIFAALTTRQVVTELFSVNNDLCKLCDQQFWVAEVWRQLHCDASWRSPVADWWLTSKGAICEYVVVNVGGILVFVGPGSSRRFVPATSGGSRGFLAAISDGICGFVVVDWWSLSDTSMFAASFSSKRCWILSLCSNEVPIWCTDSPEDRQYAKDCRSSRLLTVRCREQ